jgi:hypothetical protein
MAASPRGTNRFWVQDLIAITKLLELAAKVRDHHERPSQGNYAPDRPQEPPVALQGHAKPFGQAEPSARR